MGLCYARMVASSLVLTICLVVFQADCFAQGPRTDDVSMGVVLANRVSPIYPPLARAAHITGDVDVSLMVRQDGVVGSTTVVSGHPLLKEAALLSIQKSRFECRSCTQALTPFRLVYTFKIEGSCACSPIGTAPNVKEEVHDYPQVTDAENRITVTALVFCTCDPGLEVKRVRSAKCLYFWKCATQP